MKKHNVPPALSYLSMYYLQDNNRVACLKHELPCIKSPDICAVLKGISGNDKVFVDEKESIVIHENNDTCEITIWCSSESQLKEYLNLMRIQMSPRVGNTVYHDNNRDTIVEIIDDVCVMSRGDQHVKLWKLLYETILRQFWPEYTNLYTLCKGDLVVHSRNAGNIQYCVKTRT